MAKNGTIQEKNNVGKSFKYYKMLSNFILYSDSSSYGMYDKHTDQNFFDHLEEFLERTNRYGTLNVREKETTHKVINKKLLLLKDFPPMIFKNLERWYSLLL